jgi:hypothetical protein
VVLVLLAGSMLAAGEDDPGARPELILLWSDPQRCVPEDVMDHLHRETAALFEGWGVRLTSSEGLDSRDRHDVRIVFLDQARLDGRGKGILGETHLKPLEFPVVWILVPNVRGMLDHTEWGGVPGVLARALARVTAHEILHALAPGLGHASHGLMRPALGARDLAWGSVPVTDAFRRALLESLRRQPVASGAVLGRP